MGKEHLKENVIHVRVNKEEKEEASNILEALGTNLSAVINMLIRHVILYKGIPFEVTLPKEERAPKLVTEDSSMVDVKESSSDLLSSEETLQNTMAVGVDETEPEMAKTVDSNFDAVLDTSDLDAIEGLLGISFENPLSTEEPTTPKVTVNQSQEDFSIIGLLD